LDLWAEGPVALAGTVPPVVDSETGCVAVLAGEVHDWGGKASEANEGVAQRLLALHREGGEAALDRLSGTFVAALWDPRERRLLLVRDATGGANLVFHTRDGRLRFAATIEQLLAAADPPDEPDEDTMAWMLHGYGGRPDGLTFFAGVRRLRAGHVLDVHDGRVTERPYVRWPEHPPERSAVTMEDVELFRAVFLEATRCRLAGPGESGILISGGVDSSAVACAAALVSRAAGEAPPSLYTASYERHPALDERRFSRAVAQRHDLRLVAEPGDDGWTLSDLERWLPACAEPYFPPFEAAIEPVLSRAREDGVRVLLWGHGGDSVLAGSTRQLASLLARGRLRTLVREGRAEAREAEGPAWRTLAGSALLPLLPARLQSFALRRYDPWSSAWVGPRLAERARETLRPALISGPNAWWHELRELLTTGGNSPFAGYYARRGAFEGVEYRTPFFDRRLVDLMLRLPPPAYRRDGLSKAILRDALGDDLPEPVHSRRDKANLSALMHEGLREHRAPLLRELVRDSELGRREWVSEAPWRAAMERYLAGDDQPLGALWPSIVVELWLRYRTGR
jgi:asparagine synthase (glutamine-hydrolysing)